MMIVDALDPDLAKDIRVLALEDIIAKAVPNAGSSGPMGVNLSPAKLATLAKSADKNLRALFAGDHKGYLRWREGVKAAQTLAYRAGTDGSPTTPLKQAQSILEAIKKAGKGDFVGLSGDVSAYLAPRAFAEILQDPKAHRDMMALLGMPGWAKFANGAGARLTAFANKAEIKAKMEETPDGIQ